MNQCTLCNGPLEEEQLACISNMGVDEFGFPRPSEWIFEADCKACGITLSRIRQGESDSGWETVHLPLDRVREEVSASELEQIDQKLKRYPKTYNTWQNFLKTKRSKDRVHRYAAGEYEYERAGLTILRGDVPIARFSAGMKL